MLQAMNTGHEGSLTTIHANDTRDALSRLEMMVGMAGFDMPLWIIRRQIASAIQVVVQLARLSGGARKIVRLSEVTGMEGGDVISMHDLYVFKQSGVDDAGNAEGQFRATGIQPKCLEKLETAGIHLPTEMFEERLLGA
jgi:pilus assembly protein CpaF